MLDAFFIELALVIFGAVFIGLIFDRLKQPLLLAYIVVGIILGSSFLNVITYTELLDVFSSMGIAFLLFLVGINLDLRIIRDIGRTSLITGVGQIAFTSFFGFVISYFLGFGIIESLYIAIALTFSSTIIIVKLLSDKNELNSLYGKISIGFLLVQDFVAILILVFISSLSFSNDFVGQFSNFALNIAVLAFLFIVSSRFLVRRFFDFLANNQELLFLGSIAWCFVFTSVAISLGFSKEIGAFLAGIAIASLPYAPNIIGKLRYLRDFFIVLFFVVLGSNLVFTSGDIILVPAIIFSLFVLFGNPLIVFLLMVFLGYKGRTSFLSSLTVAQISEFSLILILLGYSLGHISSEVVSVITLVAVITISVSTYFIIYNNHVYDFLVGYLPVLRSKRFFEDSLHVQEDKKYSFVCLGFGNTGLKIFSESKIPKNDVLVIDFDPAAVRRASEKKFNAFYGDVSDLETIERIVRAEPKVIVSTILDLGSNLAVAKHFSGKKDPVLIAFAATSKDARLLYHSGVDFVLVPSVVSAAKVIAVLSDIKAGRKFELNWIKELEMTY